MEHLLSCWCSRFNIQREGLEGTTWATDKVINSQGKQVIHSRVHRGRTVSPACGDDCSPWGCQSWWRAVLRKLSSPSFPVSEPLGEGDKS